MKHKDYHKRRGIFSRLSDEALANLETYKEYKQLTSDTVAIEMALEWAVAVINHNKAIQVEEITHSYKEAKKKQEADTDAWIQGMVDEAGHY